MTGKNTHGYETVEERRVTLFKEGKNREYSWNSKHELLNPGLEETKTYVSKTEM